MMESRCRSMPELFMQTQDEALEFCLWSSGIFHPLSDLGEVEARLKLDDSFIDTRFDCFPRLAPGYNRRLSR